MKKKILVLIAVIIVCIICYLYFPRKIVSQVPEQVKSVTIAYSKIEYVLENGDYKSVVIQDQLILNDESEGYKRLISILDDYSCYKGISNGLLSDQKEPIHISVVFNDEDKCFVIDINNDNDIRIDGQEFHIGYFNRQAEQELCDKILNLFNNK